MQLLRQIYCNLKFAEYNNNCNPDSTKNTKGRVIMICILINKIPLTGEGGEIDLI